MTEKLLAIKKHLKKRQPTFVQQDAHKKARVDASKWRKPRGLQSKMRLQKKGYRQKLKAGYQTPTAVKGTHIGTGLQVAHVSNLVELDHIDKKTQGIIVKSDVGMKRRIEILSAAAEKNITVINSKDVAETLQTLKDTYTKRIEKKKDREKTKATKKKSLDDRVKKAEEKKKQEEKLKESMTEDEKKQFEKEEKDAVLTGKDSEF